MTRLLEVPVVVIGRRDAEWLVELLSIALARGVFREVPTLEEARP